MEDKIINLVGASGSGKTTIAKELEKLGYNIIHSYTTRIPREPNEWGHIFIKKEDYVFDEYLGKNYISKYGSKQDKKNGIAFRVHEIAYFNDYVKDEHYFATREQYQGKGTSIYIVDPNGAEQVKENVKDAEVFTIFLMAEEGVRCERIFSREYIFNKQYPPMDTPYNVNKNANNRIIKDKEIFKTCKCDYVIDANRELEEVVKDVIEIIGE